MVFEKAIEKAEPSSEVVQRVNNLIDCITFSVFIYTTRGLFERDKLIFTAQVAFQVNVHLFYFISLLHWLSCIFHHNIFGGFQVQTCFMLFFYQISNCSFSPFTQFFSIFYSCSFHFQILLMKKEINSVELEFLLRFPVVLTHSSPVDFLSNTCWGGIKVIQILFSTIVNHL